MMMRQASATAKGQIVSLDVVFALVVFAIALGGVLYTETAVSTSVSDAEEFRRTQDRLLELSDQLVMTRGEPDGWYNSSKIKSVGLSYRDHRLSDDKLVALARMSHTDLRGNLSAGANSVFIELLTSSGNNCTVSGTNVAVGSRPSDARERLAIDRYVLTESGTNCTLRVTLWRPQP